MNKVLLAVLTVLNIGLTSCSESANQSTGDKAIYLNACVAQESATRSIDQAKDYCSCVADEVFGNGAISDQTKKMMPTLNDKSSPIYQQVDIAQVRGTLMSCYTKNFYKKK